MPRACCRDPNAQAARAEDRSKYCWKFSGVKLARNPSRPKLTPITGIGRPCKPPGDRKQRSVAAQHEDQIGVDFAQIVLAVGFDADDRRALGDPGLATARSARPTGGLLMLATMNTRFMRGDSTEWVEKRICGGKTPLGKTSPRKATGHTTAQNRFCLGLLPFGPDPVHSRPLHRARPLLAANER